MAQSYSSCGILLSVTSCENCTKWTLIVSAAATVPPSQPSTKTPDKRLIGTLVTSFCFFSLSCEFQFFEATLSFLCHSTGNFCSGKHERSLCHISFEMVYEVNFLHTCQIWKENSFRLCKSFGLWLWLVFVLFLSCTSFIFVGGKLNCSYTGWLVVGFATLVCCIRANVCSHQKILKMSDLSKESKRSSGDIVFARVCLR